MLKDVDIYPLFNADLEPITKPEWWDSWDYNFHHYIKKQSYDRNKNWYIERGIEQKLIFLPTQMHLDVHNMSDNIFFDKYSVNRSDYLFNQKEYNRVRE